VGHPHTYGPSARHLPPAFPAAFLGNIAASFPLLNSLPSVNPSLSVLCPFASPTPGAHYRPLIAASATRTSVLLACLPPTSRSTPWRHSRLVPPTQHPASCHPPLTPLVLLQSHLWRPLAPTIAHLPLWVIRVYPMASEHQPHVYIRWRQYSKLCSTKRISCRSDRQLELR
jgi:hypothetical protein